MRKGSHTRLRGRYAILATSQVVAYIKGIEVVTANIGFRAVCFPASSSLSILGLLSPCITGASS